MFHAAARGIAEALFGGRCYLCRGASRGGLLCAGCDGDLPRLPPERCPRCALPSTGGRTCGRCLADDPAYDATEAGIAFAFPADVLVHGLKYRGELDKVRDYWYTHHRTSIGFFNAAYYWLFGHYHSCLAANYVGGPHKKKVQETTLKALMLKRNKDGTWNDHESFGPLVGTSEALMILGEIDGGFRDGYSPATQPGGDKPPEKKPETGGGKTPEE